MKTKTRYEIHIWNGRYFDSPPSEGQWCMGPCSSRLNTTRFQKHIYELTEVWKNARFRVVEVTEKVIATDKTLKRSKKL